MAYEPERAKSNFAAELSECAAYFMIMEQQVSSQGKDATEIGNAGLMAYYFANEMSNKKVTDARISLFTKEMVKEINHDWSNAAIIINKYQENCIEILNDPENRIDYWLAKE